MDSGERAPKADLLGEHGLDVSVNDACVGVAMCTTIAPDLFEVIGGRSRPVNSRVAADDRLWEAVDNCPVSAIEVRDPQTGQSVQN